MKDAKYKIQWKQSNIECYCFNCKNYYYATMSTTYNSHNQSTTPLITKMMIQSCIDPKIQEMLKSNVNNQWINEHQFFQLDEPDWKIFDRYLWCWFAVILTVTIVIASSVYTIRVHFWCSIFRQHIDKCKLNTCVQSTFVQFAFVCIGNILGWEWCRNDCNKCCHAVI